MKILNYLNTPEFINVLKKNDLPLNIIFFSLLILPFSFYIGPAVVEVLIFLTSISYIYILIIKKKKIFLNKSIIFFFSFYILLVLSSFFSNSILISLKSSFLSIRFAILTFAIIYILKNLKSFLKFFFISCFLSITLLFLSGLYQFFFNEDYWIISQLINSKAAKNTVVTGFFGEEKNLGGFIAKFSPIIIGIYLFLSNKELGKKINIILIFFTPLFIISFFAGQRMGMIYIAITLIFLLILSIKNNIKNVYKILIFFTIPFLLFFAKINEFELTVKNSYDQLFHNNKINYFSKHHAAYAATSIELFKKNPFLGIGPNNYRRECGSVKLGNLQNNCSTHPHNIFFQLIAETGILGIFFYLVINLFFIIKIVKFIFSKKEKELEIFLLLPIFYYMNPIFPSGNFFNNWNAAIGLISLPFYIYLSNNKISGK